MAPKTEENSRYSNTCPAVWGQRCQPAWENMFCWKCAGSNWFIVWTWSTQTHQLDETPLTFLSYRALFLGDYLWLASVAVTAAWLSGRHCWCPPRLSGRKCLYIYLMDCDEMLDRHSWPAAKENWLYILSFTLSSAKKCPYRFFLWQQLIETRIYLFFSLDL